MGHANAAASRLHVTMLGMIFLTGRMKTAELGHKFLAVTYASCEIFRMYSFAMFRLAE